MAPNHTDGVDLNNPHIRRYLHLVRLQVLTPLSLLINLATCLVCAFLVHPTLAGVSGRHLTSITPAPIVVGVYWLLVFAGQIGFCLLLVFARKEETKDTLLSLGLSVVLANWTMAGWAVAWTLQVFIASTVLQGILILLLLYANINLLVWPSNRPTTSRPLDAIFIHAPMRFFLIMPLTLLFWQSLFVAMHHSWRTPASELTRYHWEGVAVVTSSSLFGLLVVALRSDIVWTVGAVTTLAAIAFGPYRNTPVLVTSIVFMVLFPLTLVAAIVVHHVREAKREGAIALPRDEEEPAYQQPEPDPEVERLRIRMQDEHDQDGFQRAQNGHPHRDDTVEESVWG